ncbi:hypothetical protein HF324_31615 [Chitinophaga oryzae]|uniref:SH3 domain-containing protein n=1 Tax=Chitinophaga oryzae TaxID=2725414 RepID=A0ABX6LPY1_9BACT|nr:hypothetical protein [Chitinophaga oryzae]QJB42146.1 hypothetical protein HF324_31615 [Chitinophaga oryzae]
MKNFCYLALAMVLFACHSDKHSRFGNETETETSTGTANKTKKKPAGKKVAASVGAAIIGERVSPGTVIRSGPKGDVIATLADYIPVHCAPAKDGWCPVSVDIDISAAEYTKPLFRKGRKFKVNGVDAGVLEKDIRLPVATNGEKMWANLSGYTEKKNIRGGTVIETALVNYLREHKEHREEDMQAFISNFKLEEDKTLRPYTLYFNYESGIDDPSPLYRIVLVCQGKQLIGVVHSRPLQLPGATTRRLQRNFTIHYFNGIEKSLQEDFAGKFNKFIVSVD